MAWKPSPTRSRIRTAIWAGLVFWAMLAGPGFVSAQPPQPVKEQPRLPDLPTQRNPPENVNKFVDYLTENDAIIKMIPGQSRVLITKEDLAVVNKQAVIAVGNADLLDFTVIGPRHVRLVAKPTPKNFPPTQVFEGITDFTVTTADNKTFSFQVHVIDEVTRQNLERLQEASEVKELLRLKAHQELALKKLKIKSDMEKDLMEKHDLFNKKQMEILNNKLAKIFPDASIEVEQLTVLDRTRIFNQQGANPPFGPQPEGLQGVAQPVVPDRVRPAEAGTMEFVETGRYDYRWIIKGQARDAIQVSQILDIVENMLGLSQKQEQLVKDRELGGVGVGVGATGGTGLGMGGGSTTIPGSKTRDSRITNMLRVVGGQQILLKVRVTELNRSALRKIGNDFLYVHNGTILGTQIGGSAVSASGSNNQTTTTQTASSTISTTAFTGLQGAASLATAAVSPATAFGIFENAGFEFMLQALRENGISRILAEPNLVTMNGQKASFLAGGEFPVPQSTGAQQGSGAAISTEFKEFGVKLGFIPFIQDGDTIRLSVDPEVSEIDRTLSVTLVQGGSPVPGVRTRRAHTVVELRQGQTLAIAGLLQLNIDGDTKRIPGLGDLPILGPFFSNTTHARVEKELVVLVTPYLIQPMNHKQVPPGPGDEVNSPTDLEVYLMNRIEGRTGRDFRSTTQYESVQYHLQRMLRLERANVCGPHGFCE